MRVSSATSSAPSSGNVGGAPGDPLVSRLPVFLEPLGREHDEAWLSVAGDCNRFLGGHGQDVAGLVAKVGGKKLKHWTLLCR